MLGTDKLEAAILGLADVFNQGKESFSDGLQLKDAMDFFDDFMSVQNTIDNRVEVLAQLKDLDLIEQSGIVTKLEAKLKISNESAKRKVVKIINWLLVTYDTVDEFIN